MKRRMGFVSNSSSSSFICGICGGIQSGWDLCLDDTEMFECVNGHVLDDACAEKAGITLPDFSDDKICPDGRYEVSEDHCPTCQFKALSTSDLLGYLRLKKDITAEDAIADIIGLYGDYKSFQKAIEKLGEFKTIKGGE